MAPWSVSSAVRHTTVRPSSSASRIEAIHALAKPDGGFRALESSTLLTRPPGKLTIETEAQFPPVDPLNLIALNRTNGLPLDDKGSEQLMSGSAICTFLYFDSPLERKYSSSLGSPSAAIRRN